MSVMFEHNGYTGKETETEGTLIHYLHSRRKWMMMKENLVLSVSQSVCLFS